jgi:hypothetical protein
MLEVLIPVGVALSTGFSVLISKLHSRIHTLDERVDKVELRMATDYLSKSEFSSALERVEAHMVRIENKLDKLTS